LASKTVLNAKAQKLFAELIATNLLWCFFAGLIATCAPPKDFFN